jgi:hypothetical protein
MQKTHACIEIQAKYAVQAATSQQVPLLKSSKLLQEIFSKFFPGVMARTTAPLAPDASAHTPSLLAESCLFTRRHTLICWGQR